MINKFYKIKYRTNVIGKKPINYHMDFIHKEQELKKKLRSIVEKTDMDLLNSGYGDQLIDYVFENEKENIIQQRIQHMATIIELDNQKRIYLEKTNLIIQEIDELIEKKQKEIEVIKGVNRK